MFSTTKTALGGLHSWMIVLTKR